MHGLDVLERVERFVDNRFRYLVGQRPQHENPVDSGICPQLANGCERVGLVRVPRQALGDIVAAEL
jgi:hypothetical protein